MKLKIPFGLRDGKLVSINDVEGVGLDCNCVCPDENCGEPLIAKKGKINRHHFSHKGNSKCSGRETALHLFGKKVMKESKTINLPPIKVELKLINEIKSFAREYKLSYNKSSISSLSGEIILYPSQKVLFDIVYCEKKLNDYVPDIIAIKNGHKLLIEIVVNNDVDDFKLQKIKRDNVSAIRIDLSHYKENEFNEQDLKNEIINKISNKSWIYSSKAKGEKYQKIKEKRLNILKTEMKDDSVELKKEDKLIKSFLESGLTEPLFFKKFQKDIFFRQSNSYGEVRHIDPCPKRAEYQYGGSRFYANVELDCESCPCFFDYSNDNKSIICFYSYIMKVKKQSLKYRSEEAKYNMGRLEKNYRSEDFKIDVRNLE